MPVYSTVVSFVHAGRVPPTEAAPTITWIHWLFFCLVLPFHHHPACPHTHSPLTVLPTVCPIPSPFHWDFHAFQEHYYQLLLLPCPDLVVGSLPAPLRKDLKKQLTPTPAH